jgi:hypothetical protein
MFLRSLAVLFLLLLPLSAQADVTLVADGKPQLKIYVPPRLIAEDAKPAARPAGPPSWTDAEAARQKNRLRESVEDLAQTLKKISGAELEIVSTEATPAADVPAIFIGDLANTAFGPPAKSAPFKQGFRYVVRGNRIGLGGESDLATSYAVYELLDRLGCRWYMPGEMGEVLPQLKTIALPEIDFSSAPGTIYRGIWYADEAYKRRNRMGGLLLSAGHALEGYVTDAQRKEHPEWVGIVGGKPHARRLKWSIPAVSDAVADYWLASLEKNYVPSVSLSPDDGIDFDESAEDKALDAGDFDTTSQSVSLTDRLLVLCNRVAEKVSKKYPDVMFGMLAYGPTTRPPVREKVHPAVVPQLAPITYSRAHPMTDDAVPDNKEFRALIEGWGKAAKYTSVYFYAYFLAEPSAPNPMIKKWSIDVPFVLRHGCQFWQPETMPNFETSMHALYLGNRLAWDPALKPADIVDELHKKFYGAAAAPMAAYWTHIDDCWTTVPEYSGCGFGYLRRWTPERLARARELITAALAAAETPLELRRIRLADDSLELFELFMKLRRDQAEGRWANLAADAAHWRSQVNYLGEKYQENSCFTRVPWRLTTVNGSYFGAFYQKTYEDASRIAKDAVLLTPQPLREFRYEADADKSGESKGFAKPDFDDMAWKTTDVCTETWSSIGHHAWFKSLWYRTEVKLPAIPKALATKKIYLWLGSTDGSVKVFVNGTHVPYVNAKQETKEEFNGFCEPAAFDITSAVRPGQTNQISILTTRTFFNELGTGGLLGPVTIYREK